MTELESIAQRIWLHRDLGLARHLRRIRGQSGRLELEFFSPDLPREKTGAKAETSPAESKSGRQRPEHG